MFVESIPTPVPPAVLDYAEKLMHTATQQIAEAEHWVDRASVTGLVRHSLIADVMLARAGRTLDTACAALGLDANAI